MHPDNPSRFAVAEDGSGKPIVPPHGHATCTRCQQHYRATATVFIGTMEQCIEGPPGVKFQDMGYVEQAMILCPTCLELLQAFFAGASIAFEQNLDQMDDRQSPLYELVMKGVRPGMVFKRPFRNPMPPKSKRPEPDSLGRTPSPGVWADRPPNTKRYG